MLDAHLVVFQLATSNQLGLFPNLPQRYIRPAIRALCDITREVRKELARGREDGREERLVAVQPPPARGLDGDALAVDHDGLLAERQKRRISVVYKL